MSDPSPLAESLDRSHPPRTYLGWGLAATVLCFLPLGLLTLYYGFRTSRAILEDRPLDAAHDSRVTRRWLIATIVIGILVDLVIAAVLALLGAFSP
jgi:hypothetical protein